MKAIIYYRTMYAKYQKNFIGFPSMKVNRATIIDAIAHSYSYSIMHKNTQVSNNHRLIIFIS